MLDALDLSDAVIPLKVALILVIFHTAVANINDIPLSTLMIAHCKLFKFHDFAVRRPGMIGDSNEVRNFIDNLNRFEQIIREHLVRHPYEYVVPCKNWTKSTIETIKECKSRLSHPFFARLSVSPQKVFDYDNVFELPETEPEQTPAPAPAVKTTTPSPTNVRVHIELDKTKIEVYLGNDKVWARSMDGPVPVAQTSPPPPKPIDEEQVKRNLKAVDELWERVDKLKKRPASVMEETTNVEREEVEPVLRRSKRKCVRNRDV